MTLGVRKLVVAGVVVAVVLLANALVIAHWLDDAGVLDASRRIRSEFFTGTALTIVAVLLVLLVPPGKLVTRCRNCDNLILREGKYCPRCGSRL